MLKPTVGGLACAAGVIALARTSFPMSRQIHCILYREAACQGLVLAGCRAGGSFGDRPSSASGDGRPDQSGSVGGIWEVLAGTPNFTRLAAQRLEPAARSLQGPEVAFGRASPGPRGRAPHGGRPFGLPAGVIGPDHPGRPGRTELAADGRVVDRGRGSPSEGAAELEDV